jgi:hypothetical protein
MGKVYYFFDILILVRDMVYFRELNYNSRYLVIRNKDLEM